MLIIRSKVMNCYKKKMMLMHHLSEKSEISKILKLIYKASMQLTYTINFSLFISLNRNFRDHIFKRENLIKLSLRQ